MFGTFGEFRDFCKGFVPSDNDGDDASELESLARDLVEGCACPKCSEPLFELRLSKNDLIQFYEGIESAPGASPPGKVGTSWN